MTMTDPIADMLTRIRNANVALHDKVRMPSSKQKEALAAVLQQEGYIQDFEITDDPARPGKVLIITMKYTAERMRTISGLRRVSKPGLRVYSQGHEGAARARRPRCCRAVHEPGPHDGPRGAQAQRRRRSALRGLVSHVAHR